MSVHNAGFRIRYIDPNVDSGTLGLGWYQPHQIALTSATLGDTSSIVPTCGPDRRPKIWELHAEERIVHFETLPRDFNLVGNSWHSCYVQAHDVLARPAFSPNLG